MKKRILLVSLVLLLLLSACVQQEVNSSKGSGYLTSRTVKVGPEVAGKVSEINVREGQTVAAGDLLFTIDPEMLLKQQDQAKAAVETANQAVKLAEAQVTTAQVQRDQALQGSLMQDAQQRAQNWATKTAEDYRPAWYFQKTEAITAAQSAFDEAKSELGKRQKALEMTLDNLASPNFTEKETKLAEAQSKWDLARQVLEKAKSSGNQDLTELAQNQADQAESNFNLALQEYTNALTQKDADTVVEARNQLAIAQSRYDFAQDALMKLQTGADSLQVQVAAGGLAQAEAGLEQAKAAQAQANAALALIEAQLAKTEVKSPSDGVVMAVNLEAGEMIAAGGIVMTIAKLDPIQLDVYMPENYFGKIHLNDPVKVKVDSFADRTFTGNVIAIADQAEFTPRNVQTTSGRASSVYKITIELANSNGDLKPGMPADVEFDNK